MQFWQLLGLGGEEGLEESRRLIVRSWKVSQWIGCLQLGIKQDLKLVAEGICPSR